MNILKDYGIIYLHSMQRLDHEDEDKQLGILWIPVR